MWKLRVKRPGLKPQTPLGDIPPQVTLNRHQTGAVRVFLQLTPTFRVFLAIQSFLPGYREMDQMTFLAHGSKGWEVEIGQ
jgi:hypothetical protein